jgi:pimeloyl-ACP methyl ester carboxylesterase
MLPHTARILVVAKLVALALAGPATAADGIGIVLLHGKQGMPSSPNLSALTDSLTKAGLLVERPEMCWSRQRIYDRTYPDCLKDIDAAVERLKGRGASVIVVAGQSLGANAAIGYGASRKNVAAIIGMAPAQDPQRLGRRKSIVAGLAQARALVAAGKGNAAVTFSDVNTGRDFSVKTTPAIYLSFFAPDGPAALRVNTARLQLPLLWIAGTSDATQDNARQIFGTAKNAKNRYQTVATDHFRTPDASAAVILPWLKQIAQPPKN